MKIIAGSILILLLMTQTFSTWFVVLAFRLNREYIANNLCENRYRPQLNCKGNCVLMKKMKEDAEQEKKAPGAVKIEINISFLSAVYFLDSAEPPVYHSGNSYFTIVCSGNPVHRASDIFHPPSA